MTIRIDELTPLKLDADTKAETLPEALAEYRAALTRLTEMKPPDDEASEEHKAFKEAKAKLRQEAESAYLAVAGPVRKAEKAWTDAVNALTPERWLQAVDGISNTDLRIQVACIIWWDHFGGRMKEAWPHLDKYRAAWTVDQDADPADVRSCLLEIGFPERIVRNRCKGEAHED